MVTMEVVQGPARYVVQASDDLSLLEQLEACDVPINSLCCVGACSTCAVRIQAGCELLEYDAYGIGCSEDLGPGLMLPCVTGILAAAVAGESDHRLVLELLGPEALPGIPLPGASAGRRGSSGDGATQ